MPQQHVPFRVGRAEDLRTARDFALDTLSALQQDPQWIHRVPRPYLSWANRLPVSVPAVNSFLSNSQFIPETEINIRHANEADVVRTANLYLIHLVLQALSAHPSYHTLLVSQSEDTQGKTRTDLTFQFSTLNTLRSFAVVEFKRRGAIEGHGFQHLQNVPVPQTLNQQQYFAQILMPIAAGQRPTAQQLAHARRVPATAQRKPGTNDPLTHRFSTGPLHLIQQATAYAMQHSIRYVALFNYDWLICCYFPWLDTSKDHKDLVAENRASNGEFPVEVDMYSLATADWHLIRLALLGLMWTAIEQIP